MRRKFGKILNNLAKKDKKIILLVGDIGYRIFDDFRKEHPKRFINLGICEQSLIGFLHTNYLRLALIYLEN